MFVTELERSRGFYEELLGVKPSLLSSSAALFRTPDHDQLYLRALGDRAPHPVGGVGIQYLIWTATDPDDLMRCENVLRTQSAHATRTTVDAFTLVEGVGPDQVPILVSFPGPDETTRTEIIARIYDW
ncbi:VOC family protein [Frondihabitans sp. PAMC 28766]|uniref:VOC family protein n=1 Tax=Frondihabitans sp. PAMC 28766 TaxID=1795630 RepID=UPI001EF70C71|nr:VOC family protein [Frondihabitans sp. PAMC 28766]